MKIARVMVNLSLDRVFDYLIPDKFAAIVSPGAKVEVPFGRSSRKAFVVAVRDDSSYPLHKLKEISDVFEEHPKISSNLLRLGEWMADYYCCARELAVKTLLPSPVRTGKIKTRKKKRYYIADMKAAEDFIFKNERKKKIQCAIIKRIASEPGVSDESLANSFKNPRALLSRLVAGALAREESSDSYRDPFEGVQTIRKPPPELTDEQRKVVEDIFSHLDSSPENPGTFLLHGVTGSGKTEIYLRVLRKILDQGREAIVLVPEIALTPQTTERFRSRFGDEVSVLHSALSDGERHDEWMRIHKGKARIAIGARSALFAPFRKLGAIIVDEEHEPSYKQEESPRYNARDVAVMRGHIEKALVILGSATPSLESYHNAMTGKYRLCELTRRVDDRLMPQVRILDMRIESKAGGRLFSKPLMDAIGQRLSAGEQTMIFLNRKGFATNMTCLACGWTAECGQCSVSYTYHKERQSLSCHLCGDIIPAPSFCPSCGDRQIRFSGVGTEKIEMLCKALFKGASVARMDAETMTGRDNYEKVLSSFRTGKIQILVGTQMIAKGLDFPNVTLVGIVCADLSLRIPDFRSEERTFQLLTQVAGRAGRGERPGEVIIQTYSPSNPAIQFAVKHDFKSFYEYEIGLRKSFLYPPLTHMLAIHLRGENEDAIVAEGDRILQELKPLISSETRVSGPTPSPTPKIKGKFRYIIILRGSKFAEIKRKIKSLLYAQKRDKNIEIHADADPVNLGR